MSTQERSHLGPNGSARLWFAMLGSAVLWFTALMVNYLVVPWSCSHENSLPLHLLSAITLGGVLFAGYSAWQIWRQEGSAWSDDHPSPDERCRFMAEVGMGLSALFALLLIGMWVAVVVLGPCIPLPRIPFTPDVSLPAAPVLLAHPGAPLMPHDLWSAWSSDPAILLGLLWAGVLYGAGLRYAPRRIRRHAFAFVAACSVLLIALVSPLHALSESLFSAHMAQHTLLIAVAAPLLVLSRPVLVTLWALPRAMRRRVTHHQLSRMIAHGTRFPPGQAFVIHGVTLWVWHLPVFYQASLESDVVHALQHAAFLLTAVLFWNSFFDVRHRSWSYGAGVLYTFATAAHTSLLGALLTLADTGWYPRYEATAQAWGLTLLEDQQLAGLIMWVPGGLLYTLLALFLLYKWLRESELRPAARRVATSVAMLAVFLLLPGCDRAPGTSLDALDARTAAGLTGGTPSQGKRTIERFGCGGCHEIGGVRGANGLVGPPLNGIGKRMYIAGVLTNTPQNMARWIHDPPAVDSLTAMPRVGVSMDQARDIAAYLYTLK